MLPVSQQWKDSKPSSPLLMLPALLACFQCGDAVYPACSYDRDYVTVREMTQPLDSAGDCRPVCTIPCLRNSGFEQYYFDEQIKLKRDRI